MGIELSLCAGRRVARRWAFVVAAFGLAFAAPRASSAVERQHHVGIAPSFSALSVADQASWRLGGGLGAYYTYGLTDQFNLMVDAGATYLAPNDETRAARRQPATIAHGLVGAAYVLDVLRWVPYAGLLVGPYVFAGGDLAAPNVHVGGALQAGLDYQVTPSVATGVAARQHLLFTSGDYASFTTVLLRAEYTWGF